MDFTGQTNDHKCMRLEQFFGHVKVMATGGPEGALMLDYGCDSGNSVVRFHLFSKFWVPIPQYLFSNPVDR